MAREPMLIATTRGDFIVIVPEDQKSEFIGAFIELAGNFEVYNGECTLSPSEVANVVSCLQIGDASRITTILPSFIQTVFKTGRNFYADVRVFQNTAGKIQSVGDVIIKATESIEFNSLTKKFVLMEGSSVDEGIFTTKNSSQKIEDSTCVQPTIESEENICFTAKETTLEGNYKTQKNLEIKSRIARLKSTLAYGTHEFKSKVSNWFSRTSYTSYTTFAKIIPTVFQLEGDFIVGLFSEYHEHGIQKYCRNEQIKAASIDSSPLIVHEKIIETKSSSGFSFFIPAAVFAPICDGKIKDAIDAF